MWCVFASVSEWVYFKDKYSIEEEIILSKMFSGSLTPPTVGKTLLLLSSPKNKKKKTCSFSLIKQPTISPASVLSTITELKGLKSRDVVYRNEI